MRKLVSQLCFLTPFLKSSINTKFKYYSSLQFIMHRYNLLHMLPQVFCSHYNVYGLGCAIKVL